MAYRITCVKGIDAFKKGGGSRSEPGDLAATLLHHSIDQFYRSVQIRQHLIAEKAQHLQTSVFEIFVARFVLDAIQML